MNIPQLFGSHFLSYNIQTKELAYDTKELPSKKARCQFIIGGNVFTGTTLSSIRFNIDN